LSEEEYGPNVINLSFSQFAGIFFGAITTGIGLFAGAYGILSQDLPIPSAAVMSGVTSLVIMALLISLYNRITIERLKRREL